MNFVRSAFLAMALVASSGSVATAQEVSLEDYLASMDRTEVSFSGLIKYDGVDEFRFYDKDRNSFNVSLDAGRDAREQIEAECESSGFMVSYSDFCTVSGSGTIEIRGSYIFISIETVDQLGQQE